MLNLQMKSEGTYKLYRRQAQQLLAERNDACCIGKAQESAGVGAG
jgi:hypothetical protein